MELYELHKQLLDLIVAFCIEKNIDASEIDLHADGLESSLEYGKWHPGTDSSLVVTDSNGETIYSM